MSNEWYGWVPDRPDCRDLSYEEAVTLVSHEAMPQEVDLRPLCPPVVNQGELGSCTANAIASAFQFEQMRQKEPDFQPSRLFLYYNERDMEGSIEFDSGAQIRDGIKSIANLGICRESTWPYDIDMFAARPTDQCYVEALNNQALRYRRITTLNSMLNCLARGFPFVFGFTVYESFESDAVASSGIVPMPGAGERVVGGHAVMAVGYSQPKEQFLVRNSWGTDWGQRGYFWMPYTYLTELSDDRWVISKVE